MPDNASTRAIEFHLASRPQGVPTADNFRRVEVDLPEPTAGQVLVRNVFASVDPYMRGRMNAGKSYVAPFEVDAPLTGGAIGEVVRSEVDGLAPGDVVLHEFGWRSHAVIDGKRARKIDPDAAPLSTYLGVLGMPGLTAYSGLIETGEFSEGDVVFVSGAAGAVGSLVGQLAKARGAKRVIGSAGSAEKVRYLTEELGFDAAFNYKDGPVDEQLRAAAPDGIDLYFDNVGGEHLDAALGALNLHGRVVVCGMISQYNDTTPPPGPANFRQVLVNRLTIRGVLVGDKFHLQQQFVAEVAPLVNDGTIKYSETVVDGLDNMPQAFLDLLSGGNTGKMLVRL